MSTDKRVQRILLIDDSPEDRARVRAALIRGAPARRYMFKEASNGQEGLDLIDSLGDDWPIDCVMIDVHMPRVSGTAFLKMINRRNDFPVLPVVVLTGSTIMADSLEALQLGAQDYITKDGIYPEVLFRIVDNAIERHKLSAELHKSRIAANAASRAKSAMVGNISHEIRTPMTAVLGLCDLLLETNLNEDQTHLLGMIRDNGEYLVEIVNDLLDLSKLEADHVEIKIKPFNLKGILKRLIELVKVRAIENSTELSLVISDSVPDEIESDPLRLRQIVLNLVSNAIKFSAKGKVTVDVDIELTPEQTKMLKIEVTDTGVGIRQDELEKIFEPFVQAESKGKARSTGGTGLGLAICTRMTRLLGGQLSVESEFGVGSKFTVMLHCKECQLDRISEPQKSKEPTLPIEDLIKDCRVLVAEDTPATQFLLRRMLEAAGAKVTMVCNGKELLKTFSETPEQFNAILTDVQMPGMDGLEATRKLRDLGCKSPIVILTADVVSQTREEATQAGATSVLAKPIDRNELLRTMATFCEEAQNSM